MLRGAMMGPHGEPPVIVIHAGTSLAAYAARYDEVAVQRPERCPYCRAGQCMIGHGWYARSKPLLATLDPPVPVWVRRWLCKMCKRTTSLLPDVLHRYRHYGMAVIAQALLWRYVHGWTWVEIQARLCGEADPAMPSLDSLMRWGKAFECQAMAWLNGLIVVLAVVMPEQLGLDQPATFAQAFARMAQLARWLTHTAVGSDQTASLDDVSLVWGYGWNAGWGRLV